MTTSTLHILVGIGALAMLFSSGCQAPRAGPAPEPTRDVSSAPDETMEVDVVPMALANDPEYGIPIPEKSEILSFLSQGAWRIELTARLESYLVIKNDRVLIDNFELLRYALGLGQEKRDGLVLELLLLSTTLKDLPSGIRVAFRDIQNIEARTALVGITTELVNGKRIILKGRARSCLFFATIRAKPQARKELSDLLAASAMK